VVVARLKPSVVAVAGLAVEEQAVEGAVIPKLRV